MEIKVRNVDVIAVKKIDELAKEKKMSRNEYLKNQLEKLAWIDVLKDERNRFEDALGIFTEMISRMMRMIQKQQDEIEKIKTMFMMVMDIDEEEINSFISEFIKQ